MKPTCNQGALTQISLTITERNRRKNTELKQSMNKVSLEVNVTRITSKLTMFMVADR